MDRGGFVRVWTFEGVGLEATPCMSAVAMDVCCES